MGGSPDFLSSDGGEDADFVPPPVVPTGNRETPVASPVPSIAPPADPRAALDAMLSAASPEDRADMLARFDALDPARRQAFAVALAPEREKIAELFQSGRKRDAKRLLEKILPPDRKEVRNESGDSLGALTAAIGREKIEASPAYAEAKQKITPKTHPDPEKREAAMTAYAILHDTVLQAEARKNLGDDRANDLIADLQREFPQPKSLPILTDPPKAPWTRREEGQFQALGGDMKKPVERVADSYDFTTDKGHRMRFDTSSTPPIVSRIDERMGGVAAEVRAAPYDSVAGAEALLLQLGGEIRGLEQKRDAIAQNIMTAAAPFQIATGSDDNPEKIGEALDAALAREEEKARGNASTFAADPKADPFENPHELAALEPADPAAGRRFSDARTALAGLRETLKETSVALEAARTRKEETEAFRDRALAEYKSSADEANDRVGRNLDHFNDAGGRLLGPDGLEAAFGEMNESVASLRALWMPSVIDLGGELETAHYRGFARVMTWLIGEDLFDPTTYTLKKVRMTEDGRTVPLDDEYIREKLRSRGIVSAGDGAVDIVELRKKIKEGMEKSSSDIPDDQK